ncbi:MAG: FdtA/QdtA family cupin domain-containing protein [Clostridia bacterium]|nr:FdtA/QdtA family cupin domain-containing protein [Clostridia bacterium]
MLYQLVSLKTHGMKNKNQGALSIIEGTQDAPFEIKRIYYIHGVKAGERRGHHAHKALWQLLFCPYGKIRINIENGTESASVLLETPSAGLLLGPGVWRTMDWLQDDSVLCVAASEHYDEDDYIRDYQQFREYVAQAACK